MIQGCGSDVGKSVLTAGLCRLFADRGLRVRPFKPQNMSNNAGVTKEGGEIGRAQVLQAIACRTVPSVDMNPVLLKPQSDTGAQLVVHGRAVGEWRAEAFQRRRGELLGAVLESYRRLEAQSDLVIVEGAGSPAEINLREGDIANMGFARAVGAPVVLVGDIDRGHVIAALVGAQAVLDPADAALIEGFIVNKFRGDPALFDAGRDEIIARTGWRDLGLVPWLAEARALPAEDAVVLEESAPAAAGKARVVVPMLSRIANFDDFDPLRAEPGVALIFAPPGKPLPQADLIVLPGTKATLSDLHFLRAQGWDIDILAHVRRGGRVLGVCGGFQLLGRRISDPAGLEGPAGEAEGLGLLEVSTTIGPEKSVRSVQGALVAGGARFTGYEIHAGVTEGEGLSRPMLRLEGGRLDGAVSADGRVAGCYVHGLFDAGEARSALLAPLGVRTSAQDHGHAVDRALDALAARLADRLDVEALASIARLPPAPARSAPRR